MRRSYSVLALLAVSIFLCHSGARAQAGSGQGIDEIRHAVAGSFSSNSYSSSPFSSSLDYLPPAPEPTDTAGQDRKEVPWMGVVHYGRFSRVAVGADISPLGIGIKSGTILTETIDVRLQGDFFNYSGKFGSIDQVEEVGGSLHLNGLQTMVDFYPKNSIFRVSGGLQLWNGNEISAFGTEKGGTSFEISSCPQPGGDCSKDQYKTVTYWSSSLDPVSATADVNLHPHQPAFLLTGGFGRYIPRSERHWSFPIEFGVLFMGNPTIKLAASGSVCTNAAQTNCTDVSDTSTALGQQFQADLAAEQTKIQKNALDHVSIWPIFSYGFMYSFSRPHR